MGQTVVWLKILAPRPGSWRSGTRGRARGPGVSGPGPRCPSPGPGARARGPRPGARGSGPGDRGSGPGARERGPGFEARCPGPGSRGLGFGARGHGPGPRARCLGPGARARGPGPGTWGPGRGKYVFQRTEPIAPPFKVARGSTFKGLFHDQWSSRSERDDRDVRAHGYSSGGRIVRPCRLSSCIHEHGRSCVLVARSWVFSYVNS